MTPYKSTCMLKRNILLSKKHLSLSDVSNLVENLYLLRGEGISSDQGMERWEPCHPFMIQDLVLALTDLSET